MSLLVCNPKLDIERPPARWLSATEKRVLLAIYAENRDGGMPTQAILVHRLGLPREVVDAALTVLGSHNLVRSTRTL